MRTVGGDNFHKTQTPRADKDMIKEEFKKGLKSDGSNADMLDQDGSYDNDITDSMANALNGDNYRD